MKKSNILIISLFFISRIYCGFKINDKDYDLHTNGKAPNLQNNGYTLVLNGGSGYQVSLNGKYSSFNLVGSTISFDIEGLATAGCGCNVAFYATQLSTVAFGDYCDGNGVGGKWCPEMDFFEANGHALHVTPHCCCSGSCDGTNGSGCLNNLQKSYNICDRWGYGGGYGGKNTPSTRFSQSFGKGKYIDTNQPFSYSCSFKSNGEILVTLTQSGKKTSMTFDNQKYLSKFSIPLTDMSLIFSTWKSSDMSWLDGGEGGCNAPENCNLDNLNVKISNMKINKSGNQQNEDEFNYIYGDSCAHNNDGLCGNSCLDCRWSWQSDDLAQWSSKDANCRCKNTTVIETQ